MLPDCDTVFASHGLLKLQGAAAAPTQAKGCDEQHVNANSSVPTCVSIPGICTMKRFAIRPHCGSFRHLLVLVHI